MNTAESTRIAEKGLRQFPDDVYLGMLLAYNLAYFHHEYRRAADLLARTAGLPGAPGYLAPLATRLYAMGDSFDAAVALADLMGSETTDPQTREFFERRKQEILLEKTLREIDEAAARATGRRRAVLRPPSSSSSDPDTSGPFRSIRWAVPSRSTQRGGPAPAPPRPA